MNDWQLRTMASYGGAGVPAMLGTFAPSGDPPTGCEMLRRQFPERSAYPSDAAHMNAVIEYNQSIGFYQDCVRQQRASQSAADLRAWYSTPWGMFYSALSVAGTAAGAYHGYKRNDSVGWGLWWAFAGGAFPVVTIPLSLAQGFAKRA